MEADPGQRSATLAGMRVLIVEDEYFIADDLRRCLGEAGAQVVGSSPTFAKAAEAIEGDGFDVVVLDLNLDGDSGVPLADRLVELDKPFAIATGYGSASVPDHLKDIPRCEKPFDPPSLVRVLRRWAKDSVP